MMNIQRIKGVLLLVERKRNQERAMNQENSNSKSKECSREPTLLILSFTLASLPSKPSAIPTTKARIEAGSK